MSGDHDFVGARHAAPKLSELYQEVILDHNKKPRNFLRLPDANATAHGRNPLCGDDYFLDLVLGAGGRIAKVGFEGSGCAISKASCSMMTTLIEGKTSAQAEELKEHFIHLLTDKESSKESLEKVGRLRIFEGVRQYPVRIKCATLIWRALEEALKDRNQKKTEVSTEEESS
jgi:nitrogen fixation NifU-like protein